MLFKLDPHAEVDDPITITALTNEQRRKLVESTIRLNIAPPLVAHSSPIDDK